MSILAFEYENLLTNLIRNSLKNFTECMVQHLGILFHVFWSESANADSEEPSLNVDDNVSRDPDVVPALVTHQASITSLYWSVAGTKISRRPQATIGDVVLTFNATKSLLHMCRVNVALQDLIFNFMFRYLSTRVFNILVNDPKLCCQRVGSCLVRRLSKVQLWADNEGLNLPVAEHLSAIMQVCYGYVYS